MKALPILILSILLITAANIYADNHWIDKGQYLENDQDAGSISFIRYSDDGKLIYTFSNGSTLRFWDRETGEILFEKDFKEYVEGKILNVDISQDARFFVFTYTEKYGHEPYLFIINLETNVIFSDIAVFILSDPSREEIHLLDHSIPLIDNKNKKVVVSSMVYIYMEWNDISANHWFEIDLTNGDTLSYTNENKGGVFSVGSNEDFYFLFRHGGYFVPEGHGGQNSNDFISYIEGNMVDSTIILFHQKCGTGSDCSYLDWVLGIAQSYDNTIFATFGTKNILRVWKRTDQVCELICETNLDFLYYFSSHSMAISKSNKFALLPLKSFDPDYKTELALWDYENGVKADSIMLDFGNELVFAYYPGISNEIALGSRENKLVLLNKGLFSDSLSAKFRYYEPVIFKDSLVKFYNYSTGSPDEFLWNFGDGQTSSEENPVHTYHSSGTFTPTLIVRKGAQSDTLRKEKYIVVHEPIYADFEADIQTGSSPLQLKFTNKSQGNIKSLRWYFDDGTFSDEFNPVHEFSEPGNYSIRLDVEFDLGNRFSERKKFISVYDESGLFVKDEYNAIPKDYASEGQTLVETDDGEIACIRWNYYNPHSFITDAFYSLDWLDNNLNLIWHYDFDPTTANYQKRTRVGEIYITQNKQVCFYSFWGSKDPDSDSKSFSMGRSCFNNKGLEYEKTYFLYTDTFFYIYEFNPNIFFTYQFSEFTHNYFTNIYDSNMVAVNSIKPYFIQTGGGYKRVIRKLDNSFILLSRNTYAGSLCEVDIVDGELWGNTYDTSIDICPLDGAYIPEQGYILTGFSWMNDVKYSSFNLTNEKGIVIDTILNAENSVLYSIVSLNDSLFAAGGNIDGKICLTIVDKHGNIDGNYKLKNKQGSVCQLIKSIDGTLLAVCTTKDYRDSSCASVMRIELPERILSSVKHPKDDVNIDIFPNPASSIINITGIEISRCKGNTTIYNRLGQDVSGLVEFAGTSSINISALPDGVYYIRVNIDEQIIVRQMVVVK